MSGEGRTRHGKGRGVGRDDVSIVPYGVHNKKSVGADDPARPFDIRRIFTKMSFRGAKRRGNPFPVWQMCGAEGIRIAVSLRSSQ